MAIPKNDLFTFPPQQLSINKKGKEWAKKNVDAALALIDSMYGSGIRETKAHKRRNFNLANNVLDKEDMNSIINPRDLQGFEFPDDLENFPIANPKIDLLVGEEIKRVFKPMVYATNSDAISDREDKKKQAYLEFISNSIMAKPKPEEELQKELEELNKWNNWTVQDLRERMMQQILEYHMKNDRFDMEFKNGFKDLLYVAEEIYHTPIIAGEPKLIKEDPLSVTTFRTGNSWKIEDSDIIILEKYFSPGQIVDKYYEYLKPQDISKIEKGDLALSGVSKWFKNQALEPTIDMSSYLEQEGIGTLLQQNNNSSYFGQAYDKDGNVRCVTVYWKTKRKIGVKTFFNDADEVSKEFVSEFYKAGPDEDIKWYWVNEWFETTLIGEDLYIKNEPYAVNNYGMDNLVLKTSPMVGSVAQTNSNRAFSLMDRMAPYQYLFNAYAYELKRVARNSRGNIPILDKALIPDNMTTEEWLFYFEELQLYLVDSFKEGTKGQAEGKLAGPQAQSGTAVQLDNSSMIQNYIMMLNFLKGMIGEISGVSEQRQGAIEQRELVGNVQRAVVQSSHITEEWFMLHQDTKLRALQMFTEVAKVAYRDSSNQKRNYVLDDMSIAILTIDGDTLNEAEYGLFVENSVDADGVMERLMQFAQAGLQSQTITISEAMMLTQRKSPGALIREFQALEIAAKQREQQAAKAEQDAEGQKAQAILDLEKEKLRLEEEKSIRDDETKRYIADLNVELSAATIDGTYQENDNSLEERKIELQEKKQKDETRIKEEQLKEAERHNRRAESIQSQKPKAK